MSMLNHLVRRFAEWIPYLLTGKKTAWKNAVRKASFDRWQKAIKQSGISAITKAIKKD